MREIRPSGLEGGGADNRSPYPYPGKVSDVLVADTGEWVQRGR
jgi:hypothetical protein